MSHQRHLGHCEMRIQQSETCNLVGGDGPQSRSMSQEGGGAPRKDEYVIVAQHRQRGRNGSGGCGDINDRLGSPPEPSSDMGNVTFRNEDHDGGVGTATKNGSTDSFARATPDEHDGGNVAMALIRWIQRHELVSEGVELPGVISGIGLGKPDNPYLHYGTPLSACSPLALRVSEKIGVTANFTSNA